MKKWISLLVALSMIFLLSSCQTGKKESAAEPQEPEASDQETTETPAVPQEETPETPEETPEEPSDAPETAGDAEPESPEMPGDDGEQSAAGSSVCTEEDRAALTAVLDQIRTEARVGVAGSSLTAVKLAAVLLDWGMETPMTEAEIQETAQSWYAELESADQEEFQMQLSGVDGAVEQVLEEKGADLLDSAGCTESAYPWNDAARTAAEAVASAILTEESAQ